MATRVGSAVLAALIAAALGGCHGFQGPTGTSEPATFAVGSNQIGEPCRVRGAAVEPAMAPGAKAYDVFCGSWEQPSGHVLRLPAAVGGAASGPGGPWRQRLEAAVTCQPAAATAILDGLSAQALDCSLRQGGWPYQAFIVEVGDAIYLADGIPVALPALERTIGALSGRLNADQAQVAGSASREMARLESRLAGARYSRGDLDTYRVLLRLAQYYNYNDRHAEAEKRYRDALALQQKSNVTDAGGRAFLLMHLALELSNQERFNEADGLFKRAEALVPQALDPSIEPKLVSYRAIHLANQRHDAEAIRLAREATKRRMDLADAFAPEAVAQVFPDRVMPTPGPSAPARKDVVLPVSGTTALADVVQSKYVEASMLVEQGSLGDAERALADATAIMDAEPSVPRRWLPQIRILQASISERKGDRPRAERLLRSAIEVQQGLFVSSRTEGLARIALGRVLAAQGRIAEALPADRTGFAIIRQEGGGLRFEDAEDYFQTAFAEAARSPERRGAIFGEMFEVAQLVRGPVTAQTIALVEARLAASQQEAGRAIRSLQDAERQRDQLLQTMTAAQADPRVLAPQLAALEDQWDRLNEQIGGLGREVQAAAPRYNLLVEAPTTTKATLAALREDEAIVQVLLGPVRSVVFFVDRAGVEAYPVDLGNEQAAKIVDRLRHAVEASPKQPFDVTTAHALYRHLFGPAAERLAGAGHVITVPSGPLVSLPFGVLVTDAPPAEREHDYTETAWLARRHALSLAPSVQTFVKQRETVRPSRAPRPMIGFGNFVPNREAEVILASRGVSKGCRDDVLSVAEAPALPGTASEVRAIADLFGAAASRLVLGDAFTEANVRQEKLDEYRVVYFATHGILPSQLKCWSEPSLIASRPAASVDEKEDGLLQSSEVMELKMDADLVVLSACNSGGPGLQTGGESLSGLARAFFFAGARALLVTHWAIPDEPTVRLMTGTFNGLARQGLMEAEALRQSQLALISEARTSHPLYWAAFSLVGDGGARFTPPAVASGGTTVAGR